MHIFRMMLVTAALGLVAACGVPIAPLTSPGTVAASTAIDEKALYAAEAAYNVPAQAYVSADSRGLLSPSLKATLKPKLQTMRKILLAARSAYEAGNASTFEQLVKELGALHKEVLPLIPT